MDYVAYGLMTEEVNRVCSSTRTLFSVQTSLVALTTSNGALKSRRNSTCLSFVPETSWVVMV